LNKVERELAGGSKRKEKKASLQGQQAHRLTSPLVLPHHTGSLLIDELHMTSCFDQIACPFFYRAT
jgi:hypothetical protein